MTLRHEKPGDEEARSVFIFETRAPHDKKEAGTMTSATRGVASTMFIGRAQKPADHESEPNYWLGYSSGPRTDQQLPY